MGESVVDHVSAVTETGMTCLDLNHPSLASQAGYASA